jgi:hypothetical protein
MTKGIVTKLREDAFNVMNHPVLSDYETARNANPVNQANLLQLSDRIRRYEKDVVTLPTTDPTKAIVAFEKSHAALVKVITAPPNEKQSAVAELIAQVKSFAAEVKASSKDSLSTAQSN